MITCGLWFLVESRLAAGILLVGCFAIANLIGMFLWTKRDRIDPYQAIQVLVIAIFVFTATALVSMDCLGLLGRLDQRVQNPRLLYLLLMFPAIMLMFHFRNRAKPLKAERDT